jgi:hypothetical protein
MSTYKIVVSYSEMATDEFLVEADSADDAKEAVMGVPGKGDIEYVKNVWVGEREYDSDWEVEELLN